MLLMIPRMFPVIPAEYFRGAAVNFLMSRERVSGIPTINYRGILTVSFQNAFPRNGLKDIPQQNFGAEVVPGVDFRY